jgi:hypothetical protein
MDFALLGLLVITLSLLLSRGGWVVPCVRTKLTNQPSQLFSFFVDGDVATIIKIWIDLEGWTECMGLMRREVMCAVTGVWLHFVAEIVRAYRPFF